MFELLARYTEASPLETGLMLFPLGLIIGSFSTVLFHRMALAQSIVRPRSHCPSCRHTLSASDLVPVFSFLWRRGRCRYCYIPIPWRYPAMELASGMFAALAGWAGGWLMGFGALLLWLAGVVAVRKFPLVTSRDGVTLIEVVIAVGLLVAAMIPMLNLSSLFGGNSSFYRQVGVSIATSKVEELGDLVYRTADGDWGGYSDNVWYSQPKSVGGYSFTARWRLSPYSSQPLDGDAGHWMKQVVVVVTCNNCPRNPQPVRVSTYLEKLPQ